MPERDPADILRSKDFVVVLVFAAVISVIVSLGGWAPASPSSPIPAGPSATA